MAIHMGSTFSPFNSSFNPFQPQFQPPIHQIHCQFINSTISANCHIWGIQTRGYASGPVPWVLIDPEAPVHSRAFEDHVEVKLFLLLPVDHPLILGLNLSAPDALFPLCVSHEIKKLSATEEVYFYCRSCSTKLTKGIRLFNEMPSVDWQDVADNWFGTCCCSFGGICEKLVKEFAKSYACTAGVCLITGASVIICKEDLIGFESPEPKRDRTHNSQVKSAEMTLQLKDEEKLKSLAEISSETNHQTRNHNNDCCSSNLCGRFLKEKEDKMSIELLDKQKIFLKGCLGDAFMLRPSNLSKDVKWIEFLCPKCSCLIGSYTCSSDNAPLDDGVRLYKYNISCCLPVIGLNDLFRTGCSGRQELYFGEYVFTPTS